MSSRLGGEFCLVCGAEPPLFGDRMCEPCLRARTMLAKVPENVPWVRCARCGIVEIVAATFDESGADVDSVLVRRFLQGCCAQAFGLVASRFVHPTVVEGFREENDVGPDFGGFSNVLAGIFEIALWVSRLHVHLDEGEFHRNAFPDSYPFRVFGLLFPNTDFSSLIFVRTGCPFFSVTVPASWMGVPTW